MKQISKGFLGLSGITFLFVTSIVNAQAATLGNIIGRSALKQAGAEFLAEQVLEQISSQLGDAVFSTDLSSELFETLGLGTVVLTGAYTFYTDGSGGVKDSGFDVDLSIASEEKDLTESSTISINGVSEKGAPYNALVEKAEAKTVNGFFDDEVFATVTDPILETGNPILTGENLYAGGFAFSFLGGSFAADEFVAKPLSLKKISLKKPVPEPLTILGVGTALVFGAGFKRKLRKA